jgi:DNA modification methylase
VDRPRNAVTVRHGDAIAILRGMPDASVDCVLTDPPYGLDEHPTDKIVTALTAWLSGDREHVPDGRGFMNRRWDRFVPPPAVWDEAYRVLKPGGIMLVFAAPRTADLMGLSLRLARFTIRDRIRVETTDTELPAEVAWAYSTGFPKGLDISKAIDRMRDDAPDIVRVTSWLKRQADVAGVTRADVDRHMGTSDMGAWWLSDLQHRCQVPTWEQWTQLRTLIGFGDEMDSEVQRLNSRKGAPGDSWDQREVLARRTRLATGRVGYGFREEFPETAPATTDAAAWVGWNTALKPAYEPVLVAQKPLDGTYAENVLTHGVGALNVSACRVGVEDRVNNAGGVSSLQRVSRVVHGYREHVTTSVGEASAVTGRWPTNLLLQHAPSCTDDECADGCPAAEMNAQSGIRTSGKMLATHADHGKTSGVLGVFHGGSARETYGDTGGAARFFPSFRYQAKAGAGERPEYTGPTCDCIPVEVHPDNWPAWATAVDGACPDCGTPVGLVMHPTVKPLELIRWLLRLIAPKGAVVLDMFAGTGTVGEAAILEGCRAILVELTGKHIPLIDARLARYDDPLALARALRGDVPKAAKAKPVGEPGMVSLFDEVSA